MQAGRLDNEGGVGGPEPNMKFCSSTGLICRQCFFFLPYSMSSPILVNVSPILVVMSLIPFVWFLFIYLFNLITYVIRYTIPNFEHSNAQQADEHVYISFIRVV